MPWKVQKDDRCPASKPWAVVNSDTNRLVACHVDKDSARKQQEALYASVPDAKSARDLFEAGGCLELAQEIGQRLDNASRMFGSVDSATIPDGLMGMHAEVLAAQQTTQQLITELQPDEGVGQGEDVYESEGLAYDLQTGLPYVIMFDYRSDGGALLVGTFPTRDACIDYCHMLEPFDAEYSFVPISAPWGKPGG